MHKFHGDTQLLPYSRRMKTFCESASIVVDNASEHKIKSSFFTNCLKRSYACMNCFNVLIPESKWWRVRMSYKYVFCAKALRRLCGLHGSRKSCESRGLMVGPLKKTCLVEYARRGTFYSCEALETELFSDLDDSRDISMKSCFMVSWKTNSGSSLSRFFEFSREVGWFCWT